MPILTLAVAAFFAVIGCSDKASDDSAADDSATDTVTAAGGDVTIADNPSLVLEKIITVALDEPAALAVRCTRDDLPSEVHLLESAEPSTTHELRLAGLVAETDYSCVVAPVDVDAPAPIPVAFTTDALPSSIPSAVGVASGEPGAAYTLMPHQRLMLDELSIRLVLMDNDGAVRWYYPLPIEGYADMGAEYFGDGLFLWGGVSGSEAGEGAPRLVSVSHEEIYRADYEGASEHEYHHIAERQPDGTVVTLVDEGNFQVHQVDVATDTLVWSWKLEDHPGIVDGYGDANWAGVMTAGDGSETMVISLCEEFEVIGVDMATGELAWSLGEEGTLELTAGSRPRCQHGLGVKGDRLLLYDNGARPTSRAVEYALDVASGTIAETWSWTEDGWSELGWGDVDYLGDDRVVIARGHASGWGDEGPSQIIELDMTDDSEIWRLSFGDDDDSVYSADRIDGCALFSDTSRCPALAERLAELDAWF